MEKIASSSALAAGSCAAKVARKRLATPMHAAPPAPNGFLLLPQPTGEVAEIFANQLSDPMYRTKGFTPVGNLGRFLPTTRHRVTLAGVAGTSRLEFTDRAS